MIEAIQLTKTYGDHLALDRLDLRIEPGEVLCLLGANGAGKTTTINLFLQFIEPTSGQAKINGMDVSREPLKTKQHLAYIPEQVMLYRNLTGLENLEYFHGLGENERLSRRQLLGILNEVGLSNVVAERRVHTYSKGMRQKVGIALAVARGARALLLDEPTSGLDPRAANEFGQLVRTLSERGAAVLMATHDLFRAKESGDRVAIMRDGRLQLLMRTEEVTHSDLERLYLAHMADRPEGAQ